MKVINTKFYTFYQNNSGGSFDIDDRGISEFVVIEAKDSKHANELAQEIGLYFDGCYKGLDCDCCGDRWYESDEEGDITPLLYGESIYDFSKTMFGDFAYIHFLDGSIEKVQFK